MRAAAGGVPAKSGCARPAVGELLDGRAVGEDGQALVVRAAGRALVVVGDAGGGGDEHEALDAVGRRERDVLGDPPAHRVAAEDEALGRRGQQVGHARLEAHRPRVARIAVAAQVGRQRRIAFAIQALDHRIPGAPRAGEAVQEDDGGGHACHLDRDHRHLPAAARVRRRARALRPGRRVHLAGLALDAARAHAGAPAGPARRGRTSTSAWPASSRSAWPSRAGAPRRSRARAGRRPRTTCRP